MTTRFREARERAGVELSAIGQCLDKNMSWMMDLDEDDAEVEGTLSLREVEMLCQMLSMSPAALLKAGPASGPVLSFGDLHHTLKTHLEAAKLTSSEFGDQVGWELERFLDDPDTAWEWNVDELRDICSGLGLDWVHAVRTLSLGGA